MLSLNTQFINLIKSRLPIERKKKNSMQYYVGELVFKSVSAKVNSLRRCSSYFRFIFEQYVLFGSGYVSISCLYLFIVWRTFFFFFFCESIKSDSTLCWGTYLFKTRNIFQNTLFYVSYFCCWSNNYSIDVR